MADGERLGDYRLEGMLGHGGMGEVHRAVDLRRSRTVALKVLRPEVAGDGEFRERFRREAGATAGLQSPHIVPIHDFGEIDGWLFIDMRLIDGHGLDAVLARGPLPLPRAAAIVAQVAEGLAHAHEHGVLHRDVKPSNILLTPNDFVYLVDFGIASRSDGTEPGLTATGMTIGTWAYMAPERFDAGAIDHRADEYSLACVLAECLLGRRPFDGTGPAALMKAHLVGEPPRPSRERPDVPPMVDEVLARGMAKDPAARFGSVREFAAAVRQAAVGAVPSIRPGSTGTGSHPPAPTRQAEPALPLQGEPGPRRRSRMPLVIAGVVLLVLVLAAGVGLGRVSTPENPPAPGVAAPATAPASTTAGTQPATAVPTTAPVSTGGPTPTGLPSLPVIGGGQSSSYTYTVESNYPVHLIYTDAAGDQITAGETTAPWTLRFDTTRWGSDARPSLSAFTMSSRGDTYLSCTIADADGRVVATQRQETAHASVMCMGFG